MKFGLVGVIAFIIDWGILNLLVGVFRMNDAIIWISTYGMNHDAYVSQSTEYLIRTNVGKLIATAVVMVWNFLTRKWLLDDTHTNAMNRLRKADNRLTPEELEAKWQNSFSHKLGIWSLEHTPNGWPK